ncbi:hypothetical protein V8C34DRAFT_289716, partial [Trichoderma compactum]
MISLFLFFFLLISIKAESTISFASHHVDMLLLDPLARTSDSPRLMRSVSSSISHDVSKKSQHGPWSNQSSNLLDAQSDSPKDRIHIVPVSHNPPPGIL